MMSEIKRLGLRMDTGEEAEITKIADCLAAAIQPEKIYLFGSTARGTATEGSDFDFYLVVDDAVGGDLVALSQKAYRSLRGIRKHPVDIVIASSTQYNDRKHLDTLEQVVDKEGRLLYGK